MEWPVRRSTEKLRRHILDTASLGRLQFLGGAVSRLFLNMLGLCTYRWATFVLFAVFYDEGNPEFGIVSSTLFALILLQAYTNRLLPFKNKSKISFHFPPNPDYPEIRNGSTSSPPWANLSRASWSNESKGKLE
jgi:hypothetical protein